MNPCDTVTGRKEITLQCFFCLWSSLLTPDGNYTYCIISVSVVSVCKPTSVRCLLAIYISFIYHHRVIYSQPGNRRDVCFFGIVAMLIPATGWPCQHFKNIFTFRNLFIFFAGDSSSSACTGLLVDSQFSGP